MRKTSWRIAQAVVGIVIIWFAVRSIQRNWADTKATPIVWDLHWHYIIASLIVTWLMYGVLILGWREVLAGWRQRIKFLDAAGIWTVSSLGKYIPGKVWSIAGMAAMAERQGISGRAAMGSAIIMQLISIATGAVVAIGLTGVVLMDRVPGGMIGAIAVAVVALVCAIALTSPSMTRRIGFLLGRPDAVQPVEPGSLAGSIFANVIAWAGYGFAFQLLVHGTMPSIDLDWSVATGAFAASYIAGYLFLFAPGGLGVREGVLTILLKDVIGLGPALALVFVSRATMTVADFGAAIPFLLRRRPTGEAAQA